MENQKKDIKNESLFVIFYIYLLEFVENQKKDIKNESLLIIGNREIGHNFVNIKLFMENYQIWVGIHCKNI